MAVTTALRFWFFVLASTLYFSSFSCANELSLVVGQSAALQLPPGLLVEKSPGFKAGNSVVCERVQLHGLSRLRDLRKFAHSVKVRVSVVNYNARLPNVEVCFHRNVSLGLGMCPQDQWEKLVKGLWVRSMSPFDHKLLDIRAVGSSLETVSVSIEEEFFLYRVILLVLGVVMMTLASYLSKSLVFYYSSAMAVGIILVILMVLFQGMRLLPTGRKSSLAIFVYSSIVGLGSFLLSYLPGLMHSVLLDMGISEELYNPLALFLLVFIVLAGAWLGFWVVRKLVLTEDGLIDIGVSHFVGWSIWIFAAAMILQSSVDPVLAVEALLSGIIVSSVLRRITKHKLTRRMYKKLCTPEKSKSRVSQLHDSSPVDNSSISYINNHHMEERSDFLRSRRRPVPMSPCSTRTPPGHLSDSDIFYSSYHKTPDRRKFSNDEWEKFTRDSTKRALEELVSSPDFSKWAVANAERITLAPGKNNATASRQSWFPWTRR